MSAIKTDRTTVINEWLPKLCEALLRADPDIVAIVQFGSSVYAPEEANDIDLFILTKQRKDLGIYMNAVCHCPLNVDVVPVQLGERVGFVGVGVRAFGRLLFGDADAVWEVTKDMPVPTFDEAREVLDEARRYLQDALNAQTPTRRELHYRNAFNSLFDSARLAAMAYLLTEETRWGILMNRLPDPFDQRFRVIMDELHVAIFYHRTLPLDVEAEFDRQQDRVLCFINDLEAAHRQP